MKRQTPRDRRDAAAAPMGDVARALAARRIAASALRHVTESKATLDDALARAHDASATRTGDLDSRDRHLARGILTIALKRLGTLRAALDSRLRKKREDSPPELISTLIVAAAQILFMAVPAHAAVDTAVELIRADRRLAGLAGLTNAVLRGVAADRDAILARHDPVTDWPGWLTVRWRATYGDARMERIAAALGRESTLDITPLRDAGSWAEKLGGTLLPTGSIRLASHASVETLPGYADGAWLVQDAAAALPARFLAAKAGERVLDLCAAPGGKTAQLATTGASVTAIDRSAARLERLSENLARLKLTATIIAADAATFTGEPADAILLDAPCTGTGTIRRHPDIAWTKSPADLASLAALQARLLDRAVDLLKPGGRLVYSTCSLEPEEGEQQIAALVARRPDVRRDPIQPDEIPGLHDAIDADGALRTTPDLWPNADPRLSGLDGFYAARLVRAG